MKKILLIISLMITGLSFPAQAQKPNTDTTGKIHCRIEGKVVDNPDYNLLMLLPAGSDARVTSWIPITVKDGKFSYDFYTDTEDAYTLIPKNDFEKGMMFTPVFFAEEGKINLTFYSANRYPDMQSDATLTKELLRFKQETDSLFMKPLRNEAARLKQEGKRETAEMLALIKQMEESKDEQVKKEIRSQINKLRETGKAFTPEFNALQQRSQENFKKWQTYILEYCKTHPTLVGLYLLKEQVASFSRREKQQDMTPYINVYRTVYSGKFPESATADYMDHWLASRKIKVGGKYIDFSAPDLNGASHTLSEEITGKVALIDLWASWCGPCRRTSLSMIPVYEAYKDKGFTIVGVARERNSSDMENALAKDKYPWLNLLELNDAGKIWEMYGIDNRGGCTYLVDKDGKIIAINPTAEEVKTILEKLLK